MWCNYEVLFQVSSVGYHMSVTRLPTKKDVQEEVAKECKLCPEAVERTLATMLDMSLLKSPTFLLLSFSGFITMMGFYVPFMYLTGVSHDQAVYGLSTREFGRTLVLLSMKISHVEGT
jgi:hypothetical protein